MSSLPRRGSQVTSLPGISGTGSTLAQTGRVNVYDTLGPSSTGVGEKFSLRGPSGGGSPATTSSLFGGGSSFSNPSTAASSSGANCNVVDNLLGSSFSGGGFPGMSGSPRNSNNARPKEGRRPKSRGSNMDSRPTLLEELRGGEDIFGNRTEPTPDPFATPTNRNSMSSNNQETSPGGAMTASMRSKRMRENNKMNGLGATSPGGGDDSGGSYDFLSAFSSANSGSINFATDTHWVDDVKSSLARGIQSGLLTADYSKLLVTEIEFDLPASAGNRVTVLVDSGAQTSALSRRVVDRLNLWPIVDRSFARNLGGIAGSVTSGSHGRLHYTRLRLGPSGARFDCAWEVLDLPGYETGFEGIIGLDFLAPSGIVDLQRMTLELTSKAKKEKVILPLRAEKPPGS
ncbi:unnamed protein product [Amoebophrya sp. A25]|nr:unnamed protein product [Amoebophrya sp. A25]|eukprot:GSA25T00001372001.1